MSSRPLRVVMVGPLPPPSGGMANQTRQLRRLLEAEGLAVPLVQTNAPYRPAWVGRLRGLRALFRLLPYRRNLAREVASADVVHVMANSGLAWHLLAAPAIGIARRHRKPVVVNYRGGLAAEFLERAASRVIPALTGCTLVVPSRFLQEVFARHGVDSTVVPNVVDVTTFRPSPVPRAADASAPHIVIARALEPIYGIDLALRALSQVHARWPQMTVSIAGTGPEAAHLQALADELGLAGHVRFTGRLEVAQMVQLYQQADVVMNPVRADNTPNSVLEALACGVPVLSTRVGGVPYLVEHEVTAMLVPPESPDALARGLERLLDDGALRARLRANGLELARRCAWPQVREQWLGLYRRLAA